MVGKSLAMSLQENLRTIEENDLVLAAKKDPRRFTELYDLYLKRVFGYFFSRVRNLQDAEDLTSLTFLKAFESLHRYRMDGPFAAWLFTIARNKANDHFRKHHTLYLEDSSLEATSGADTAGEVQKVDDLRLMRQLIRALPEEEQELIRLRVLAQLSYPEMARLLNRPEATVKKATYRLLARLQSQMELDNE